uniref:ISAzo13-like element transposase-related protein n=1 Tax=Sedimentitalea todarodis TaxID=1631240 RepID=UPI0037449053
MLTRFPIFKHRLNCNPNVHPTPPKNGEPSIASIPRPPGSFHSHWRGRPLTDRRAVIELIGATTTRTGLKVECALDTRIYEKGVKVSNAEIANLDITGDAYHPEWNYTIRPRSPET